MTDAERDLLHKLNEALRFKAGASLDPFEVRVAQAAMADHASLTARVEAAEAQLATVEP